MENHPDIRTLHDYDVVILADGDQPNHEIPLRLLREAPFVVCCDGAVRHCDRPDAVVGDGDSIPPWAREKYGSIFHRVAEQEDNDLTKATRFCLSRGMRRPVYLGATGGREDHTVGNISLLARYRRLFDITPLMATNHGWFVAACGPGRFASFKGQQVSIFNFGCSRFEAQGLVYPCRPYQSWWEGTLNEACGDNFSIEADSDYLVFRTY